MPTRLPRAWWKFFASSTATLSGLAGNVASLFLTTDLRACTTEELARGATSLQAFLLAVQEEEYRRTKWTYRPLWDRRSPNKHDVGYDLTYMDHLYRLTHQETGKKQYRSEPYQLHTDGMQHLLTLSEEGWNVVVTASGSLYYPGQTLVISLSKKEKS